LQLGKVKADGFDGKGASVPYGGQGTFLVGASGADGKIIKFSSSHMPDRLCTAWNVSSGGSNPFEHFGTFASPANCLTLGALA